MDDSRMEGLLAALEGGIRRLTEATRGQAPGLPTLLKPKAAARELSVGLTQLKAMVRAGEVKVVVVGKRKRIPAAEIRRLADEAMAASRPRRRRRTTAGAYDAAEESRRLRDALRTR